MSTSSASAGHLLGAERHAAPPAAAAMWRAKLSGPKRGLDRIRRASSERVRAGAVPVRRRSRLRAPSRRRGRPPHAAGAAACRPARAARARIRRPARGGSRSARPRTGRPERCRASTVTPLARLRPTRRARSAVTTAISSSSGTCRSVASTSLNIAWASALRAPSPSTSARRCFAAPKLLTGRMAIVRTTCRAAYMLQPAQGARRTRAPRAPAAARLSAVSISVSVTSDGRPSSGSSATIPSSTSAYAAATPAALASMPACSQNASVGPLTAPPADEWAHGHHRSRRRAQRLAHSGQREDRADRDHRVGRADHDRLGRGDRLRAPRRRAGARSSPRSSTLSTGPSPRSRIMNSWNGSSRPRAPTQVETRLVAHRAARAPARPSPRPPPRCASVRLWPARSSSVRTRHIARSRSPSRNQCGRPARSSASITFQVSSRRPQPRSSI